MHAKCFDAAVEALRRSRSLEAQCSTALHALCSIVVEGTCEIVRAITLRCETGELPSTSALRNVVHLYEGFASSHDMVALAEPDQRPIQVSWKLVAGVFHCWSGDPALATLEVDSVRDWMNREAIAPWMESLEALARCEIALAAGDLQAAERAATRMLRLAHDTGREQSALMGHVLACRVLEQKGDMTALLLKALAARERGIREDTVASRSAVVAWQMQMRRSESARRELQASAALFEKLTLEDPLTGIANRRCFERAASESLGEKGSAHHPLSLALVDVDSFKQINDSFGHLVGDKVLQIVASLLIEHVRADDTAARLAGDEFVVLFRRTDLAQACAICARLRHAVATHDWSNLGRSLQVSISVGVAESLPGDTLEQFIDRSDQAMYAEKKRRSVRLD
jgi:diguanylate cyclase (GGDEF)-like protein